MLINGWNNAAAIHGKDPSQVTTGDKYMAAGASALQGLTFGLVDAKTGFKWANDFGNLVTGYKEQDKGNFQESASFKYAQKRLEQKKQIQDQFETAKSDIADTLTGKDDPAVLTQLANATNPKDSLSIVEQNLFNTAEDRKNDFKY